MTSASTLAMIRDAAEALVTPDAARVRRWRGVAPGFDRELWRNMAGQGWLAILPDEDAGGLGLGLEAAAVVARVLGVAAAPEPFVAAGVVPPAILAACEQGREYLERIATGDQVACLAWQDPHGRLDPGSNVVVAEPAGAGVALRGECRFVPVARADAFIVLAGGGERRGLYWLPAGSAGLSVRAERHADGGASGWLVLDDVRLGAASCLAGAEQARAVVARAIDVGVVASCAELLGVMDRMLALTLEHLRNRRQFGQPIGSFQALQHRAVDLWMQKEVADHATNGAIRIVGDAGQSPAARAIAASGAKARVGEAAMKLANEAVQLHGAMGFTDEYELGVYVNRTLALVPFLGNAAEHRARYGALRQRTSAAA